MDSKIFAVTMGTGLGISAGILVYWTSGGHFGSAIGAAISYGYSLYSLCCWFWSKKAQIRIVV